MSWLPYPQPVSISHSMVLNNSFYHFFFFFFGVGSFYIPSQLYMGHFGQAFQTAVGKLVKKVWDFMTGRDGHIWVAGAKLPVSVLLRGKLKKVKSFFLMYFQFSPTNSLILHTPPKSEFNLYLEMFCFFLYGFFPYTG